MAREDKRKMIGFNRKDKDSKFDSLVTSPSETTTVGPMINQLDSDSLRQGQLYLIRVRMVKLALFEGWNDDSCLVFSILRDESTPMRWSEGKYLAGDFDVYEAFDSDGNPPIWIWKRFLNTEIPKNWFHMFEEARRRQSDWNAVYGEDMKDNELSSRPQSVHNVGSQARGDGSASPAPGDRENLRAFIMGSATEPTNGTVNSKQFGTVNTIGGLENKPEVSAEENGK